MKNYFTIILILIFTLNAFSQSEDGKVMYDKQDTIFSKDTSSLSKCFVKRYGWGIYIINNLETLQKQKYYQCNDTLDIDFEKKMIMIYCFMSTGKDFPRWKQKIYEDEFGNTIVYFDIYPKIKMHSAGRIVNAFYIIDKPDLSKTVFQINNRYGKIFSFKYDPNKSYIKFPNR